MIIILFGVTGAGKTLIGSMLAAELGWQFYDADHFHPMMNIEKMKHGVALTDDDRSPWLQSLCELLVRITDQGKDAVLACSALKEAYRQRLGGCADTRLVFLRGEYQVIEKRLMQRQGHFMSPELLRSQFEALEEPQEGAIVVDVKLAPREIVEAIRGALNV